MKEFEREQGQLEQALQFLEGEQESMTVCKPNKVSKVVSARMKLDSAVQVPELGQAIPHRQRGTQESTRGTVDIFHRVTIVLCLFLLSAAVSVGCIEVGERATKTSTR